MRKLIVFFALLVILCGGCAPKSLITLRIPNTDVQIMMKLIPAGSFLMGSPPDELDRNEREGPQYPVNITEPFYIGVYEVTQEQWEAVMGTNPSWFDGNPSNPVEMVSWDDCQDFITELNTKGIGTFRLPTEAEWEYACRAGSTTRFSYGDDPTYNEIGDYAWYSGNSSATTNIVGQKEPNAWGLYDMHGNVTELCSDWFGAYPIVAGPVNDPQGPLTGELRIRRGGDWNNPPQHCRSASRGSLDPIWIFDDSGFRLVRTTP